MVSAFLLLTATAVLTSAHGPFTEDFVSYLEKNPERHEYTLSAFKSYDSTGTFGGKTSKDGKIDQQPVVFVHGNSDSALHHSEMASGWTKSVEHFKKHGYSSGELYGLSYGARDITLSLQNSITCRNLLGLRRFMEAILEYTEAPKIDVVAHSMGVTLARKAIKGGKLHLTSESCDLGESLSDKIDALVAIAGANYGMCMCLMSGLPGVPACGEAGFAPGSCGGSELTMEGCMSSGVPECEKHDYSRVLRSVNAVEEEDEEEEKEAAFVASLWSSADNILGTSNRVWGRLTSLVPGSDFSHIYDELDHFQSKDQTVRDQLALVSKHALHGGRAKRHHH